MDKAHVFTRRERAIEAAYFRAQDARMLEALRARATFDELAWALREKLEVDDPALLQRIRDLGVTQDTGAALLLAPLVQIAWTDGEVAPHSRDVVLDIAASRGIAPGSPAHAALIEWLTDRPSDELFETALLTIRAGLSVLPPPEQDERVHRIAAAFKRVAMTPPGFLGVFGSPWEISHAKADEIDRIILGLRSIA